MSISRQLETAWNKDFSDDEVTLLHTGARSPLHGSGVTLCRLTLPRALLRLPEACSPAYRFCSLDKVASCAASGPWVTSAVQLPRAWVGSFLQEKKGLGAHELPTRKGRLSPEENQIPSFPEG